MKNLHNYQMVVSLSIEEILKRLENMYHVIISLNQSVTENITIVVLSRKFMRMHHAIISMTLIIEEKEKNLSEVTLAMCSPSKEGFLIDTNAGKSMRSDLLKQLESHVVSFIDVTPEDILNADYYD